MKRVYKYLSALAFTGLLMTALITGADAQHRGGGGGHGGGGGFHGGGSHGGGGGFHGGGGGFHGGGSFRGSAGVRSGGGSFRGAVGNHVAVRGGNFRGAAGNRAAVRGGVYSRGGTYAHGGAYARGGYYRGGRYYGGGYRGGGFYRGGRYFSHYGYGGFRFGFGFGYPHIGFYLGVLPYGYYPFYWGSSPYYYYGGAFYRPYNGGYEVVVPPVGASIPNLPANAQSIVIDGQQYYEMNGVYYQEGADAQGRTVYTVVGKDGILNTGGGGANVNDQPRTDSDDPIMDNSAPTDNTSANNPPPANKPDVVAAVSVGDVVNELPADCRKVTLNNKKFYVSPDNIFYEEYKDDNGKGYRVASVPTNGSNY